MNFSIVQWVSFGPRLWYAWKHSIQPFAYCSAPFTQLSGPAFHMCMWLSTTKYFSSFFSYTEATPLSAGCGQVEADVLGGVLGVGEHDRPVVEVNHAPVVGRHVLLELGLVEVPGLLAERFGDVVVDEVHPVDRVDPDHRRQVRHGDVVLTGHHLSDNRADLVVHQRHAALVGRGVVLLERAFRGGERAGHSDSS